MKGEDYWCYFCLLLMNILETTFFVFYINVENKLANFVTARIKSPYFQRNFNCFVLLVLASEAVAIFFFRVPFIF